jgi:hypothetical protein
VQGYQVVIRWVFEFEWLHGGTNRIEELACQLLSMGISLLRRG